MKKIYETYVPQWDGAVELWCDLDEEVGSFEDAAAAAVGDEAFSGYVSVRELDKPETARKFYVLAEYAISVTEAPE